MPADPELLSLGRRVRACRKASGLSQEKLAELAGLHRNYVGFIERGERNANVKTLFALARALRVAPVEFWVFD
ncbi:MULTISPECIES: helix-turn-helix domain-containing protein [unclassified Phenylobacterium]|uniref:helix-turn-helix domain-containing protein n=1 Tax=unclassified Phenylobacterium TaxID=2640670 RepID=UPI0009E81B31|nr:MULTISPECIES: helix-turn-helix transcriptional regulator [unclassified Phenylobacterium]